MREKETGIPPRVAGKTKKGTVIVCKTVLVEAFLHGASSYAKSPKKSSVSCFLFFFLLKGFMCAMTVQFWSQGATPFVWVERIKAAQ